MPDLLVDFGEFGSLATSILRNGQRLRFKARGASMRPFIQDGDLLEVKDVLKETLIRGDVVLCRVKDGRLVVHRVIRIDRDLLLIQGDALPYPDGWIHHCNVLGLVETISHQGNHVKLNSFWITKLVRLWLLLTPLRNLFHRAIAWLLSIFHTIKTGVIGIVLSDDRKFNKQF